MQCFTSTLVLGPLSLTYRRVRYVARFGKQGLISKNKPQIKNSDLKRLSEHGEKMIYALQYKVIRLDILKPNDSCEGNQKRTYILLSPEKQRQRQGN